MDVEWIDPSLITTPTHRIALHRLYRVRRGKTPGTFYYTVLDNGVTSAEYWRILGTRRPRTPKSYKHAPDVHTQVMQGNSRCQAL